jgi:teichuronic acid biosynthesis glycosyltransferase TuaG
VYVDVPQKVDWLDEMIQSVVSQSISDWELILINDKSPMSIGPVRMKHKNDSRIRWLENAANQGPAATRNTAVALAESECILPLDSDDMLADSEALEFLYDAWLMDRSKTVYGNIQLYRPATGGFERSKVFQLAHYSFEGAMNLQFGIMPVTTMHSKDAHYAAGGWKPVLKHGREDLEYWIACGKAGYCGTKITHTTLLYRKHEQSRDYKLKFELRELEAMQHMIKDMHSDIYRGEFPMACCGGKGKAGGEKVGISPNPEVISQKNQAVIKITELSGYKEEDLEWVTYQGQKNGSFSVLVRGPSGLPSSYMILGTGHSFQAHKAHHKFFSEWQHLGFRINQPDPREQPEPEPEPEPTGRSEPQAVEVPTPQLSTLVQLDRIGTETREVEIVNPVSEIIIEPNPADSYSDTMVVQQMPTDYLRPQAESHVSNLGLSDKLAAMLDENGYTVEKLAKANVETLSQLPGIATKRGQAIVEKAKDYMMLLFSEQE